MKSLSTVALFCLFALWPATLVADDIEPSEIDKKKNSVRRAAFTEWMSADDFEEHCEEQRNSGKYILYIDDNGGYEYRGIFGEVNPRGYYFYYGAKEESLIGKHKEHSAAGMKLLTLSESRSDRYSAVWISERSFAEVSAQLELYGIGLGKIEE